MKSIFVGNLPWSATEQELQEKFAEFGNVVSTRLVTDKFTGRSRGFAFIDMNDEDAEKAIAGMKGVKWGDRDIVVNEAKPKSERPQRSGGSGSGGGGRRFSRF